MITNDTLCKTVVYHCRIKSENEVIPFVGDNKQTSLFWLAWAKTLSLVGRPPSGPAQQSQGRKPGKGGGRWVRRLLAKRGKSVYKYIYTNPSPLEIEGTSFPFSLTQLKK